MLCQLCKNKIATVCINVELNGVKTQQYICEECATQRGLRGNPTGADILRLVNDIKAADAERARAEEAAIPDIACSECGTAYKEFLKSGQLGCQGCYAAFGEHIARVIKDITKPDETAATEPVQQQREDELQRLEAQLKQCIEEENYEEAAVLRDKINAMKTDTAETLEE